MWGFFIRSKDARSESVMYGSFFPRVTLSMASDAHLDLLSHCTQIMRGESPCACGSGAFRSTPSCNKRVTNARFRCRTAQQIRFVFRPTPAGVGSSEKCASTRRGMRVTCVLQCVEVCCSVLQRVAVCCSVLQCVIVLKMCVCEARHACYLRICAI